MTQHEAEHPRPTKEVLQLFTQILNTLKVASAETIELFKFVSSYPAIKPPDLRVSSIALTCPTCEYQELLFIPEEARLVDLLATMSEAAALCPECEERYRLANTESEQAEQ